MGIHHSAFAAILAAALTACVPDWRAGTPTHPSPFNDLTVCQTFEAQMICFDEFETWYGMDATPIYYVENGVFHPIPLN